MNRPSLISVSLRKIHTFSIVCDTMHMARAAERLGISQPSLSEQIQGLEQALGFRLFHRRRRAIDLTEAGQQLLIEARALLQAHHDMLERVGRIARGEMGRLAIGHVGSAMFVRPLAGQLKAMRKRFPGVDMRLREAGSRRLLEALAAGDLDLVLLRAPLKLPAYLRHRVHSSQKLVVVMPPGHVLAGSRGIHLSQLAAHVLVDYAEDDQTIGITPMVRELAQQSGVELQVSWRVTTVGSVLGLVASGEGIGIVPDHAALRASRSVVARVLKPPVNSELWLVWHQDRETPTVRQFLAIVGEDDGRAVVVRP